MSKVHPAEHEQGPALLMQDHAAGMESNSFHTTPIRAQVNVLGRKHDWSSEAQARSDADLGTRQLKTSLVLKKTGRAEAEEDEKAKAGYSALKRLTTSNRFQNTVFFSIFLAAIVAVLQTYTTTTHTQYAGPVEALDSAVVGIFILECVLKVGAEWPKPWRYWVVEWTPPTPDPREGAPQAGAAALHRAAGQRACCCKWRPHKWNNFDFAIAALSVRFSVAPLRLLRMLRAQTLIFRTVPQLRMIFLGLLGGLRSIGYICVLLLLVMYIYGIAGFYAFTPNDPVHFGNLAVSMLTLFRTATLEDWSDVMYINQKGCNSTVANLDAGYVMGAEESSFMALKGQFWHPVCTQPVARWIVAPLFFVSFVVITAFVMLSLFVGAVTLSMTDALEEMKQVALQEEIHRKFNKARAKLQARERLSAEERAQEEAGVAMLNSDDDDDDNGGSSLSFGCTPGGGGGGGGRGGGARAAVSPAAWAAGHTRGTHTAASHTAQAALASNLCVLLINSWSEEFANFYAAADAQLRPGSFWRLYASWSRACRRIRADSKFQTGMSIVVVTAGITAGLRTQRDVDRVAGGVLMALDDVIFGLYVLEMVVKVVAERFRPLLYLRDAWNRLDFTILLFQTAFYIVNASVSLDKSAAIKLLNMVRLMRLLRVLQLVKTSSQLKLIVGAVLEAAHAMRYIGLIHFLFYFLFALGGFEAFSKNDPVHFGNFHTCMLTLFRCATLDDWTDVMYINMFGCKQAAGYERYPELCTDNSFGWGWVGAVYFVVFIVIGSFVLLSLFIGVVTATMEEAADKMKLSQEIEARVRRVQAVKKVPSSTIDHYREVYRKLDVDRRGAVEVTELRIAIMVAGQDVGDEELNALFGLMDANGNGHIDFAEFLLFICDVHQAGGDLWKLVYLREVAARSGATIMPEAKVPSEESKAEAAIAGAVAKNKNASLTSSSGGHGSLIMSAVAAFGSVASVAGGSMTRGSAAIIQKAKRRFSVQAIFDGSRDAAWRRSCRLAVEGAAQSHIGQQISSPTTPIPSGCRTLCDATRKIRRALASGEFAKKPTLGAFYHAHEAMVKRYKDAAIVAAMDSAGGGGSGGGPGGPGGQEVSTTERLKAAQLAADVAGDQEQAHKIAVASHERDGGAKGARNHRRSLLFEVRRASGDELASALHARLMQPRLSLLAVQQGGQQTQSDRNLLQLSAAGGSTLRRSVDIRQGGGVIDSPVTSAVRALVPEAALQRLGGGSRAREEAIRDLRNDVVRYAGGSSSSSCCFARLLAPHACGTRLRCRAPPPRVATPIAPAPSRSACRHALTSLPPCARAASPTRRARRWSRSSRRRWRCCTRKTTR